MIRRPGPKTNGSRLPPKSPETTEVFNVPPIEVGKIVLKVRGDESLVVHNWSAKAKRQMLDKQCKRAKTAKEAKDPFADFLGSLYIINASKVPKTKLTTWEWWPYVPETFGFKAIAFKNAIVSACGFVDGVTKTLTNGAIRVPGGLLPIKYEKLIMREDMVKIGNFPKQTADLRYRGEFTKWSMDLPITFMRNVVNVEQIVNLLNHAGFAVGIGEHRPEREGSFGTFTVEA